jgi:hypothetical protein
LEYAGPGSNPASGPVRHEQPCGPSGSSGLTAKLEIFPDGFASFAASRPKKTIGKLSRPAMGNGKLLGNVENLSENLRVLPLFE